MIQNETCDVAVIGAGAAGLAAGEACALRQLKTIVIDRDETPGGILRQCIHNGFGLGYFKEELTGPEYALRVAERARKAGAEFLFDATVTEVARLENGEFELLIYSGLHGVIRLRARAVMLAMGCRERNRGNLATPGTRPAGIFTAGAAQKLLNIEGMLPGKTAVIVGSGDIGLIMARRLTWSGVEVKAVVEIMPTPSGLTRNVVQCLHDFNIPLHLEHGIVNIEGRERVQKVDVAPLKDGIPVLENSFSIDCDTLLFSVGLLPENELSRRLGVAINPATGGPVVDDNFETNVPGVFSGGNVLHVHDLVDFVSEEAGRAGDAIVRRLNGEAPSLRIETGVEQNLRYVIPNFFTPGKPGEFFFRSLVSVDRAEITASQDGIVVFRKKLRFVRPAEMIRVSFTPNGNSPLLFNLVTEEA